MNFSMLPKAAGDFYELKQHCRTVGRSLLRHILQTLALQRRSLRIPAVPAASAAALNSGGSEGQRLRA